MLRRLPRCRGAGAAPAAGGDEISRDGRCEIYSINNGYQTVMLMAENSEYESVTRTRSRTRGDVADEPAHNDHSRPRPTLDVAISTYISSRRCANVARVLIRLKPLHTQVTAMLLDDRRDASVL